MALLARLLRLATSLTLAWLLLATLWLALPSPSRESAAHPGRYERETLAAGRPLLRVYDNAAWVRGGIPLEASASDSGSGGADRRAFALSYRLEERANTTLLTLRDGLSIDLAPAYVRRYPFVSEERSTVVKTGDQDGINPPWFQKADSTLLFWWVHRDTATLRFRVRWWDAETVELGVEESMLLKLSFEVSETGAAPRMGALREVQVGSSSGPSRTYALRVVLLAVIAPTGLLVMGLIGVLEPILGTVFEIMAFTLKAMGCYVGFVALVWVIRGRRPIAEDHFVSRFPGMEFFGGQGAARQMGRGRRRVWGSSGPIEVDTHDAGRIERRPIRNVADFFRSSAPLDDLLATFDGTRHFTEPMRWRDGVVYQRPRSRAPSIPDTGLGRHRKAYSEDSMDESGLIDLEKALPEKPAIVLKK